jgi:AcrR family transcriptional regulator
MSATTSPRSSRREDLLAAAATCFVNAGLRKTTMEDVAREAGAGKATLYRYFANKDALIDALLEREGQRFQRRLQRSVDTAGSALGGLEEAFVAGIRFFTEHPVLTRGRDEDPALLLERVTASRGPLVDAGLAWFASQVADGQRAGQIRPEVQPRVVAEVLMRLVLSYFTFPPMVLRPDDDREIHRLAREIVVRGLGTQAR